MDKEARAEKYYQSKYSKKLHYKEKSRSHKGAGGSYSGRRAGVRRAHKASTGSVRATKLNAFRANPDHYLGCEGNHKRLWIW